MVSEKLIVSFAFSEFTHNFVTEWYEMWVLLMWVLLITSLFWFVWLQKPKNVKNAIEIIFSWFHHSRGNSHPKHSRQGPVSLGKTEFSRSFQQLVGLGHLNCQEMLFNKAGTVTEKGCLLGFINLHYLIDKTQSMPIMSHLVTSWGEII